MGGDPLLTAKAEYNSNQYLAKAVFGNDLWLPNGMILTSKLSGAYSYLYNEPYNETGAGGANLVVEGNNFASLDLGVGVDLSMKLRNTFDGSIMRPVAHLSYTYDSMGEVLKTAAKFSGGTDYFTTSYTPVSPYRINAGGGIVYNSPDIWALSANYDFEYKDSYNAHSAAIRLTSNF